MAGTAWLGSLEFLGSLGSLGFLGFLGGYEPAMRSQARQ